MKKSFFGRLSKVIVPEDEEQIEIHKQPEFVEQRNWTDTDEVVGQLTVDVFETANHITIKTIVAGVRKEDLEINLSRDMVTIKGKREVEEDIEENSYFHRELYWGTFSRTILLPQEVDIEHAEATENQGLLTIRLPKIDKGRQTKLRVKSI